MPWEYLATKEFEDARYLPIVSYIEESDTILDLNCGQAGFHKYVKCKNYTANDIFVPENTEGIDFKQLDDTKVDWPHNVLCCFGYGGGEFTGEPLESKTTSQSIFRLVDSYHPRLVVIEMAEKWETSFEIMSSISNYLLGNGYDIIKEENIKIEPVDHYHNVRVLRIFKRKAYEI